MDIRWIFLIFLIIYLPDGISSQAGLQPGQFNLATGRKIAATATCGDGVAQKELYCKLIGANLERGDHQERLGHDKYFLLGGQVCAYCDPAEGQGHPAEYAIDGTERWWQSPPLSRGSQQMEVNLTIDFNQEFHVAYVFVTMGNSPRPEVWALERSTDYGKTWKPWQYFADPPSDCETYFGILPDQPVSNDDDIICTSKFSRIVPLEGGEISISLVNDRPGATNFLSSMVLQNWTKATNVRLAFMRMKTLMGHTSAVARQDPSVTRRYFYSIRDISIGGLCVCNGHASSCEATDPSDPYRLLCRCAHNTCGANCDRCCPGFVQKKWRAALSNASNPCEPCNCHGHSSECEYDPIVDENRLSLDVHGNFEGGGVCRNCQDNTEGINCEKCRGGYYRPYEKSKSDRDACQPCRCDRRFSTGNCAEGTGICECKANFTGTNCDRCSIGYHSYPDCLPCECNYNGTLNAVCNIGFGVCPCKPNFSGRKCDQCKDNFYDFPNCTACDCDAGGSVPGTVCDRTSGQCVCQNNFGGQRCDRCGDGYYGHPRCQACDCDPAGTVKEICSKDNGVCICKPGFSGPRCDQAAPGYFGYPVVKPCECNPQGSLNDVCDAQSGRCPCKTNYSGRTCDQCAPGFHKFPQCDACNCDSHGSIGTTCNNLGQCQCKKNFVGKQCNQCAEGYYNYPLCEGCNCNPAGLIASFGGCGSIQGELCQCKERVTGRICDRCKAGYWGLDIYNPFGCDECQCNTNGTVSGLAVCEDKSGQCPCKSHVEMRQCTRCKDGFYGMQPANLHGCTSCGCDVGGAVNNICDKLSGQCFCRPRVGGNKCDQVLKSHYFPTLHHLKFEAEDGRTKENGPVQYEFKENDFPGYSWRGYAVMSPKQEEIVIPIQIRKPSLYRMVIRFVNLANTTARADIVVAPESNGDGEQKAVVDFVANREGRYVSVGEGTNHNTFILQTGVWLVTLKTARPVLIDYIVLLPQAYYEASILQQAVHEPCRYGVSQTTCRNYTYPDTANFIHIDPTAVNSFYKKNGDTLKPNIDDTTRAGIKGVHVDQSQPELTVEAEIFPNEPHVLVLSYFTRDGNQVNQLKVNHNGKNGSPAKELKAELYDCPYNHECRSAVLDSNGKVAVVGNGDQYGRFTLIPVRNNGDSQPDYVLTDITAIPVSEWHDDFVRPQSACILVNGKCEAAAFPVVADASVVEAETDYQISQMRPDVQGLPATVQTSMLYLANQTTYLRGSVQRPGDYIVVLHYYLPNGPGGQLEAAVQGVDSTPAVLETSFCPSASGCRAILRHADSPARTFRLGKDVSVSLNGKDNHELYLDYMLLIPADKFEDRFLRESGRDLAAEFISQCGQGYFDIDPKAEGFCRQGTFSLVTSFQGEALPCECYIDGSTSLHCDEMGGQCKCKENVIGRKCNRCKSGYWGFPNCRRCNCPFNSVCDPVNGNCICPPRVTGERCDTCMPRTYGFHPITGCQDCRCNPMGTNGSLDCEQEKGECFCKPNVGGRTCDKCITGHYAFPHCQACHYCDVRGATDAICDQNNGQCLCKENVGGTRCDMCKPSTFLLDAKNPAGCTKCFCFGITSRCEPSMLHRSLIPQDVLTELAKWSTLPSFPVQMRNTGVEVTVGTLENPKQEIYWVAPASYLGNRITSYGGKLAYGVITRFDQSNADSIFNKHMTQLQSPSLAPDVVLKGRNMTVVYVHDTSPVANENHEVEIELVESNFEHEGSGNRVTREQFMQVLVALEALHIKAGYFPRPDGLTLTHATLETALPPADPNAVTGAVIANKVEQCACPPQYSGTSCEDCAPLHYRSKTGPYLGVCLPCECNNHAERCDPDTGKCINCLNNTMGERCEMCIEGYHGDATRGTPYDCMICACPLPVAGNNFATSCDVAPDGVDVYCRCREEYTGSRCQHCAPGYYGRPEVVGDYCKPCQCNGHIDPRDPESCHPETGECMRCLNNTAGPHCETCRTDFFGDPTTGSCQVCTCDPYGTKECDTRTGECRCWPNVVGERCDRSAPKHWNFISGQGASACECAIGAKSEQCNELTGQCDCQPGTTGKRCEQCAHGYWNYTAAGCTRCACATKYSVGETCDQKTGECSCLPGVTGAACDRCKPRHVLVENVGCESCGYCVHTLLDDFDEMNLRMGKADSDFARLSASHFAALRVNRVNDTIRNLTTAIITLQADGVPQTLAGFDALLFGLEKGAERRIRNGTDTQRAGQSQLDAADAVREQLLVLMRDINQGRRNTTGILDSIKALENYLRGGAGSKVAESIATAEPVLKALRGRSFDAYRSNASIELGNANVLKGLVFDFNNRQSAADNRTQSLKSEVENHKAKMRDLEKWSLNTTETAAQARAKTDNVRGNITDNINALVALEKLVKAHINNSTLMRTEAQAQFTNASTAFDNLPVQKDRIQSMRLDLQTGNTKAQEENLGLRPQLMSIRDHVSILEHEANRLDQLFGPTRNAAATGRVAATTYDNIVANVNNASAAVDETMTGIRELQDSAAAVRTNVGKSMKDSETLNAKSEQTRRDAVRLKNTLEQVRNKGQGVEEQNARTEQVLTAVRDSQKQLPKSGAQAVVDQAGALTSRASAAGDKASDVLRRGDQMINRLTGATVQQPASPTGSQAQAQPSSISAQELRLSQTAARDAVQDMPRMDDKIRNVEELLRRNDAAAQDLGEKVRQLRERIAITRTKANAIRNGMQLFRNNSVQVKNPRDLSRAAAYTKISLYFKTKDLDGLLFYLGNEVGTSRRVKRDFSPVTDDFMALEIQNGHVVLTFDLGSGPARIEVQDEFVSDNRWHQAVVERTGKLATLRVFSPRGDGMINEASAEGVAPGQNTVFNLNQENSTFFIGGMPLSFRLQTPVRNKRFAGFVEGVEFDMEPISLWNFGNYTHDTSAPAVPLMAAPRNELTDSPAEEGLKFDGTGFAAYEIEARVDVRRETSVILEIKTFDKDGLLFFLGQEGSNDAFYSVELHSGHILFQYNLGSGTVAIRSPKRYNDGKWHTISTERYGKEGLLQVDGQTVANSTSPGHEDQLDVLKTMYLGGYPKALPSEVSTHSFEGCMRSLEIASRKQRLENVKESKGTVPGCPETIRRLVTFDDSSSGYLSMPSINVEQNFQITLKFKTVNPNGLIFLTSSDDASQLFSLALVDGRLVLTSDDGKGRVTPLSTDLAGYWNGEWHYVSASKEMNRLRLMVDDFETVQAIQERADNLQTSRPLYFGGIPSDIPSGSPAVPSQRNFVGCIGDVVVNGIFQNFAISQDRPGASFDSCGVQAVPGQVLPTLPPQPTSATNQPFWQPPITTAAPVTQLAFEQKVVTTKATTTTTTTRTTTTAATTTMAEIVEVTTAASEPGSCALSIEPNAGSDAGASGALLFGSQPTSRQEFNSAPANFMDKSEFSVDFKTTSLNGVIVYVDDQKPAPIDFLAIYLKEGYVIYSFNPGAGVVTLKSTEKYADGNWHSIIATKSGRSGKLSIDGVEVASGESGGKQTILNTQWPLYLGGINGQNNAAKKLEGVAVPFDGCLRNFKLNGLSFPPASNSVAIGPCSDRVESGVYFPNSGGYIALSDKFVVGRELEINLEIRPRSNDGILLAVFTSNRRRDFLALQLVNGMIHFSFDNGMGLTQANISLPNAHYICDGGWHTISAIKTGHVATLTVDNRYTSLETGKAGQTAADTDMPLYLGALPESAPVVAPVVRKQYVGCMRNLQLNGKYQQFAGASTTGSVSLNACPVG